MNTYNLILSVQDKTTPTPTDPVLVQEVKAWLRLEGFTAVGGSEIAFNDDDTFIAMIITAVREQFEKYCGITLTANRVKSAVITNLCGNVELPFGPVKEVTAAEDKYGNDILSEVETVGEGWVCLSSPRYEEMKITYTAGYGTIGCENLPASLKLDMLRACAYYYVNRGDEININNYISQLAKKYSRYVWLD